MAIDRDVVERRRGIDIDAVSGCRVAARQARKQWEDQRKAAQKQRAERDWEVAERVRTRVKAQKEREKRDEKAILAHEEKLKKFKAKPYMQ